MPPPATRSLVRSIVARLLVGATIAYLVVLVFATHYPKPERFLAAATTSDKTLHFLAYGLLATLAGGSVAAASGWTVRGTALLAGGLMAFAGLDEVTQPLFPPRTAEWLDWGCDCAGIAVGLAAIALVAAVLHRLLPPRGQRQLGVGAR